jgi:hypothetical protein
MMGELKETILINFIGVVACTAAWKMNEKQGHREVAALMECLAIMNGTLAIMNGTLFVWNCVRLYKRGWG